MGVLNGKATRQQVRIQQKIDELGPWFHNLHLPGGLQTFPDHPLGDFPSNKWSHLAPHIPDRLDGLHALDIGCNAGFYSFELAQRGADVTAIDVNPHYLAQAQWAASEYGLSEHILFKQMQVYDLAHSQEMFDVALFIGVFYHLRYPMLGLDIVAQKVKKMIVFQSMMLPGQENIEETWGLGLFEREIMHEKGWPKLAFIEHNLADDPTNWWVPNHAGILAMLRSSGMYVTHTLKQEIYLCEPDPEHPACINTWNKGELLSATGRSGFRS